MDSRWLAGAAGLLGAYIVWAELNFRGRSTITPILVVLGAGIVLLAGAHLVHERMTDARLPSGAIDMRAQRILGSEPRRLGWRVTMVALLAAGALGGATIVYWTRAVAPAVPLASSRPVCTTESGGYLSPLRPNPTGSGVICRQP